MFDDGGRALPEGFPELARPGVTERELVREFDRTVAGAGARPKFTLIKIGRSGVAGQARPSDVELRRGDAIWFDVGLIYQGYWSDIGTPERYAQAEHDASAGRISLATRQLPV